MSRAHLRDVLALLVLVTLAGLSLRCGAPFTNAAAGDDAGALLEGGEVLEVPDAGADRAELLDVHQGDAGEVLEASPGVDVQRGKPPADAGDELAPIVDAGGAVDVHEASAPPPQDSGPDAPALCCHITCGTGTLPASAGWTCPSGTCTVGGACDFMTACGVVVTCP